MDDFCQTICPQNGWGTALGLTWIAFQGEGGEPEPLSSFVRDSGVFGWLAVVAACFLVVYGGLLIALRPPRRVFALLAGLSLVPMLIGGLGMFFGQHSLERAVSAAEVDGVEVTPRELASARRQARLPLKVGAVAGAPVLALALLGLAFPRGREDSEADVQGHPK